VVAVGLTLQPDVVFLDLLDGVARTHADYFEIAPETLWTEVAGRIVPNGFHAQLLNLKRETRKPFVGHCVGLSLASFGDDAERQARWHAQITRDAEAFELAWLTDHLGASVIDGESATLPLPVPMTDDAAQRVHDRLRAVQRIVPDVGVENTCHYFVPGDPLDEPRFIADCLRGPRMHLLLDLHNLYAMACNLGFDAEAYLSALDLDRVIEIHVAGGVESAAGWLPGGATLRLDGHDASVPEAVWQMLERVAPRCRNLRGVTLERMEGTVDRSTVPSVREELLRIREVVA
jgi:uncharacterized protein (UPF0276 family)